MNTRSFERDFGDPKGYKSLGRYIAPSIELEMWFEWCSGEEAKALGLTPDEYPRCPSLSGYFLYRDPGTYTDIRERVLKELKEGKKDFAEKIFAAAQKCIQQCDTRAKEVRGTDEINAFFDSVPMLQQIRLPWFSCFAVGEAVDACLKEYAERHGVGIDELSRSVPTLENSITADQKRLLVFAGRIKKAGLPFDFSRIQAKDSGLAEELERYQLETEYLGTHHFWGDPRSMPRFIEALASTTANHDESEVKNYPELENIFVVAAKASKYRLECAQSAARLAYAFRPALTIAAEKISLTYNEFIFLLSHEMKEALADGTVDRQALAERAQDFGLYVTPEGPVFLVGESVKSVLRYFNLLPKEQIDKTVKGNIGKKGIARGRVAIVLRPSDNQKVKEGMILIAPETTPDFVPAMARAAAFVTDQGGITSHAAIVAREMGKPCIIGTKVATQVFKDGDLVEVDADTGVVRKLENNG